MQREQRGCESTARRGNRRNRVGWQRKGERRRLASYSAKGSWFDILANWSDLNVVALATDKDCATLVLRAPGFAGGYREAIVETRMIGGVRKVTAAQTESMDSVEGSYVIGRIEHAGLGGFPVVHARAAREEGVGLVVYFSDKPIAAEPFETLVTRHACCALSAVLNIQAITRSRTTIWVGRVLPVEQLGAVNSNSNPSVDERKLRTDQAGRGRCRKSAYRGEFPLAIWEV